MRFEELLREALERLVRVHEDYSVVPRDELGRILEASRTWAEHLLGDLAAAQALPPSVDPSAEWRSLMNGVTEVWLDALVRCKTDEERQRAHKHFAAAVNALCALATAPHLDATMVGGEP